MHYHSFYSVDGTVLLWGRIYVTSIEIDAVSVYSKVTAGNTVRIKYGKDVENEVVSEYSANFAVFCKFIDDSSHHMRTWNFSRMHSRTNYNTFLVTLKLSGP